MIEIKTRVRCDGCERDIAEGEWYFLVQFQQRPRTSQPEEIIRLDAILYAESTDRHFCSAACLVRFYGDRRTGSGD